MCVGVQGISYRVAQPPHLIVRRQAESLTTTPANWREWLGSQIDAPDPGVEMRNEDEEWKDAVVQKV